MIRIGVSKTLMRNLVESYDTKIREERDIPTLHFTFKSFRAHARNALHRNMFRTACPRCHKHAILVVDGFGDDGSVGFLCMGCGGTLNANRMGAIRVVRPLFLTTYRDSLRKTLAEKGVDWRTGWLLQSGKN